MEIPDTLTTLVNQGKILLLGSEQATFEYGSTTFSKAQSFAGAIIVNDVTALSSIIKTANENKLKLHPVSSNKNWGYGSIRVQQGAERLFLLDLGALKKIHPTKKDLGLITIEPGVTQQDLFEYLEANDWPYMVPVTGAGPTCSLISNALERGYGITPYTDHFYACTSLKGYFPHPDLAEKPWCSAVSELDTSGDDLIDKTFKWGLGPYVDGLFTQSNLGIVTEMTLRLAKKPSGFSAFYIQIFDNDKFEMAVQFIRDLLESQSGMVGSINLMDKRRLVSMTCQNPNLTQQPIPPLSDEQVNKLAKEKRLPEWMIVGSIYGDPPVVSYVKKYIKKEGKKLGRILYSDSLLLKFASSFTRLPLNFIPVFKDIKTQLTSLQEGVEIMLGKPNQVALPLPYWRNPEKQGNKQQILNPSADNCGLLWYAPLIPMNPIALQKFVSFVRETMLSYGLDPLITFTNLKYDCIDSTVPLVFNKHDPEQQEKAMECLKKLIDDGCKMGFVPYRLPIHEQQRLTKDNPFWKTVDKLKKALDPNNILSPGKYDSQ